jgi:peptide/nickel transport system permease protein
MYSYIARRLVFGALTVVGVSIMVFVIMRILPGDPLVAIFGPEGYTKLTDAQRADFMRELGLSDPLWLQYLRWAGDIFTLNFGRSFFRSESVAEMIGRRGPLTAEIALISVLISWLVGIPVAIVSALKPNTASDSIVRFFSILFIAVPGFWVGMLIVLALLFWFGYRAPMAGVGFFTDPIGNLQLVLAPGIVLGLGQAAYIARMGRSALLEVIREDYVRTGPRQGAERPAGDHAPCLAQRAAAGDHPVGRADGAGTGGLDPGRARLRHAGDWAIRCSRR